MGGLKAGQGRGRGGLRGDCPTVRLSDCPTVWTLSGTGELDGSQSRAEQEVRVSERQGGRTLARVDTEQTGWRTAQVNSSERRVNNSERQGQQQRTAASTAANGRVNSNRMDRFSLRDNLGAVVGARAAASAGGGWPNGWGASVWRRAAGQAAAGSGSHGRMTTWTWTWTAAGQSTAASAGGGVVGSGVRCGAAHSILAARGGSAVSSEFVSSSRVRSRSSTARASPAASIQHRQLQSSIASCINPASPAASVQHRQLHQSSIASCISPACASQSPTTHHAYPAAQSS